MTFRITFTDTFWSRFKETIFNSLFFKSEYRYNFGYGSKDVKIVCNYWKEEKTRVKLQKIINDNSLKNASSEYNTVARIVRWVNTTYPSSKYYLKDIRDEWNHPLDTLESFDIRRKKLKEDFLNTDCDDYAILIYSLCRVAGVDKQRLYLAWMKTTGEWHMNCMYFSDNIPYALEGTYYPDKAMKNFGKVNYFNTEYYKYVKWLWNEDKLFRCGDKINKLGTD
jgi:predicted transglutaminase-like cysteine proteinase